MWRIALSDVLDHRGAGHRRPAFSLLARLGLLLALAAPGCHHEEGSQYTSVSTPPAVSVVRPRPRDLVQVVGQPSFIESYERASVYPKMNAYIEEWKVDIGDQVKKDQVLATLFVPELVEDHHTKEATVTLARERVELAKKVVEVAQADVRAAAARLVEAKAALDSFRAEVKRWDSEVKRLDREVGRGVVDPQSLLQATNRWKASVAGREAAEATVLKASAELLSRRAALSRAEVGVRVAEADLKVADSEERRLKAWVGYLVLPAPYDGVIVARNANTFDFVLPTTGDPSADPHVPHLSPSGGAAPIYVVDRTDIVRVFMDVPEKDANHIKIGTKASVLVHAFRDAPIPATVTRTSWALQIHSRTLRTEIDLHNPGGRLLPGMYAYAKVIIERPGARALPVAVPMHIDDHSLCEMGPKCERAHAPASALVHVGEKTFCWMNEGGSARRMEIRTGLDNGRWVEVTNRRPADGAGPWAPFDGTEQVILGDLSILSEGGRVKVIAEADRAQDGQATAAPANREKPAPPARRDGADGAAKSNDRPAPKAAPSR